MHSRNWPASRLDELMPWVLGGAALDRQTRGVTYRIAPYVLDVEKEDLLRGRFYDFAHWGKSLSAGGTYRAVFGAQTMVFQIDPHAEPGYMPVMSRLLRFVMAS